MTTFTTKKEAQKALACVIIDLEMQLNANVIPNENSVKRSIDMLYKVKDYVEAQS